MSTFTKKDFRSILTLLLKALGAAGIPGGVAADAVNAAADRLDARRARQALQEALEKADNAFRADARGRGWGDLADAVLQLPIHNLPAFEAALHDALAAGNPAALHAELTRQLTALPGVEDPEVAAEAARLYAARVLDAAWSVPAFRDAARDLLFRQQHEALQRLIALVEHLPRWWRLTPALQPRPKSALVVGERRDIPLTALKAPVRLVPFVGRERERDALKAWAKALAAAPARAGLRVVTGPGGMGKTRLAVETAAALCAEGWEAFFLPPEPLRGAADPAHLNPAAEAWFTPSRPTLYILDYAEQIAPERLRALLATLHASAARRAHPVALLFLMRPAPEPNWVDEVASLTGADVAFAEWLRRAIAPALQNPLRLQGLAPAALLRLFAEARRTFIDLRGQAPEREITYDAADLPARPLAVVLLGLLAAYGHKVARSASEQAVLEDLWERWEKDKWRRTLRDRGLPEGWMPDALRMIETALVVATLGRRFHSPQELAAFWQAHDPPRHPKPNGETLAPHWLAAQMPLLFPAVEGGIVPAIVPDPLADFVLARRQDLPALARAALPTVEEIRRALQAAEAQEIGKDLLSQVAPDDALFPLAWPLRLLPLLLRLREAYPRAGLALAEALADWLGAAAGELHRADPAAAARWLDLWEAALPAYPDRTPVAWREVFAAYCRARLAASGDDADKAMWQGNLSVALSALGKRIEALAASEEAVAIRRRLAEQNPQAYAPDLAMSLNNLAADLADLGRREEALAAAEEAAGLYRRLAEQNPQAYAPDLAMSLNNLAADLADLGRREEALAAAEEAAGLYRRLAEQNPQAYAPYLAGSLNNLGKFLSEMGRREEALAAAEEAAGLYRRLAGQNPQAYEPDLAMSLHNLATDLADLGRREEALAAAEEAAGLYRRLAEQNPQAYAPYLALSLNNLGKILADLGRREEALAAAEEAVGVYRRLAEQNPQAYAFYLATSLETLGLVLLGLERPDEAFSTFAEGLRVLLPQARRLPRAFGPLFQVLLKLYLHAAQAAGQPPDEALVREAQAVLGTET